MNALKILADKAALHIGIGSHAQKYGVIVIQQLLKLNVLTNFRV